VDPVLSARHVVHRLPEGHRLHERLDEGRRVRPEEVGPEEQAKTLAEAGVPQMWVDFTVATDASIKNGELEVPGNDLSALIGRPTTPLADSLRTAV
jgi:NAD(P)H dehydrogenase (quinone)